MKSALLEWKEIGFRKVGPGAFRENPDTLFVVPNLPDGTIESSNRGLAVRTIDEYSSTQSHYSIRQLVWCKVSLPVEDARDGEYTEPAEEGNVFETSFCGDAAVLGKYSTQEKNIELSVSREMISTSPSTRLTIL